MMMSNVKCCRKGASSAVDRPRFRNLIGEESHQGLKKEVIGPRFEMSVAAQDTCRFHHTPQSQDRCDTTLPPSPTFFDEISPNINTNNPKLDLNQRKAFQSTLAENTI
ncbi:hypothetical protein VNO77_04748 [Canavalia gladiata]|uniref:Uncharacterized protein n=1 Tax=Canavalia gladiata TaxID=3824 RepID=A0AAN9R516_CANGL